MADLTLDDETVAAFESDFGAAAALHGIDESHREVFTSHWSMNPQLRGSEEGLKSIAEFAQLMTSIRENPLAPPQKPAATVPKGPAPPPPDRLDKDGQALYRTVEERSLADKVDWFTAFAKVTGNTAYKPPRVVPGPPHGSEPVSLEDEDHLGQVLMRSHAIAYLDAVQLVRHTKELAETRKGPETDVPWLDTRPLSAPPRPWSDEDWERDRRRAAAGNVTLDRAEWEVAAEEGEDLVSERAEKARADHLAELEGRSEYHVRTAQKTEAKMRVEAIEAELDRRAESRIEDLKSRRVGSKTPPAVR